MRQLPNLGKMCECDSCNAHLLERDEHGKQVSPKCNRGARYAVIDTGITSYPILYVCGQCKKALLNTGDFL